MEEKLEWEQLSANDRESLLKAPMLLSLLAASTDEEMDRQEKSAVIELAHLRTFTAPKILQSYYKEVEKMIEAEFDNTIKQYSPIDEQHQESLKKELGKTFEIIEKLGPIFKEALKESLNSYAKHIGEIHRNFLEYFALPLNIPGVTD